MDFNYPALLELFSEYLDSKRSESASFLIWYLEKYYRLDPLEAVDSVCDQRGDKGIDGIYVDDNTQSIIVFQSKISQKNATVGDSLIRTFAGTLGQLKDSESVISLINSAGEAEVARLLERLQVANKISEYEVRGEIVTNIEMDENGKTNLNLFPNISFVGRSSLLSTYISDERDKPIHTPTTFDISGFNITEYVVDTDIKAYIAPIRARELIKLDGIQDQSLFSHNVRASLGKTRVNREITKSVDDSSLHKKFPLFHNGVTIISGQISITKETINISDYFVVNGCQSITSLFSKRENLTDDLYVLSKFIQVDPRSSLAKQITEFSNNQNGVTAKDFKANSKTQIRLQNEIRKYYKDVYDYAIKRGEQPMGDTVISNEDAGLSLMAFDLMEPWATHRKYRVFDEKHSDLFGRPEVDADRIVLCQIIKEEVEKIVDQIDNRLLAKYRLTRYLLIYLVRRIFDMDEFGKSIISKPKEFVRESTTRAKFRILLNRVLSDTVTDLNLEVAEYGDDFDYRGRLRDDDWVKKISNGLIGTRKKLIRRQTIKTLADEWQDT